jgi:hypothetical protein
LYDEIGLTLKEKNSDVHVIKLFCSELGIIWLDKLEHFSLADILQAA